MLNILKERFPELKGYVISNPADVFYLIGFYCVDCLLLYSADPVLVTDTRYEFASKEANCRAVMASGSYVSKLIEVANAQGLKELGIEEDSLSAGDYMALCEAGFTLARTNGVFTLAREKKSDDEVKKIQAAQDITDKAFSEILGFIKPGVTEKEVRAKLEYLMFSFGADGLAFDTIIASGANGAKPHAVPSDKKIEKGEFVTLDFGARLAHYDSDMTRTVAVGDITDDMKRIYDATLEAHIAGAEILAPGVSGKAADEEARKVYRKYDLEQYFSHSLGHGVGIEIHEEPRLSKKSETILDVGDIVTVEPGVYIEGFCGVRIENMYVIDRNGHKNLTASDKNLIKIQ